MLKVQSLLKNKTKILFQKSKIITQHPQTIQSPNFIDIKWVTKDYTKNFCKLYKIISWARKVSQVGGAVINFSGPLSSETTKTKKNP